MQVSALMQRKAAIEQENQINEDGDRIEEQLKKINDGIFLLNNKSKDGLRKNIDLMYNELKKQTKSLNGIESLSSDKQTPTKTIGERASGLLDRVKNLPSSFLKATNAFGINNKRIAKLDFIKEQKAINPEASTDEIKERFEGAYEAKKNIKSSNDAIEKLKEQTGGKYSEEELMKSSPKNAALFANKNAALAEYAKFDYGSKLKMSDAEQGVEAPMSSAGGEVSALNVAKGSSAKEAELEANAETRDQIELLTKIEENTRPVQAEEKKQEKEESGSFGFLRGLFSSLRGVVKSGAALAGAAVKTVGRFAMANPAVVGGVVAAGTAYGAYKKYTGASDTQEQKVKRIEERVASGEITQEKADQLKKEASGESRIEKNEAVGEGVLGTGGAVAGAVGGGIAGAKIGALFGPMGAAVGGLVGSGVGAFSGSEVGKDIGGALGNAVGKVSNFIKGESTASMEPAKKPTSAYTVDQKSKEVETEKMNAMAPNKSANTTVIAPSTNVNNNSTTTNIKSPIRNQESTQREYFKDRYAY